MMTCIKSNLALINYLNNKTLKMLYTHKLLSYEYLSKEIKQLVTRMSINPSDTAGKEVLQPRIKKV